MQNLFPPPFKPAPFGRPDDGRGEIYRYWTSTWRMGVVLVLGSSGWPDPSMLRYVRCVRGGTDPKTAVLPATGLQKCFDPQSGYAPIPCDDPRAVGQDARLQVGCPMEGRFVDKGDGTITDRCTGLMWQKEVPFVPPEYEGDKYGQTTWKGALRYARDLRLGGYDDWRLPNLHEMVYIMDLWYGEFGTSWSRRGTPIYPFEAKLRGPGRRLTFWTSSATERYWHFVDLRGLLEDVIGSAWNKGTQCIDCRFFVRCVRGPIWLEEKP